MLKLKLCKNFVVFSRFILSQSDSRGIIEAAGAQVVYLPPYSPDLNRIEKCWAWLKSRIRRQLDQYPTLREAIEAVLHQAAS